MSVPPRLAQTLQWTGWMHTGVKAFSLGTAKEEVTLSLFTKQKKHQIMPSTQPPLPSEDLIRGSRTSLRTVQTTHCR